MAKSSKPTRTIEAALKLYAKDIKDGLKEEAKKNTAEALRKLKETSPKKTGEYAKGWESRLEKQEVDGATYVLYNATKPRLTHLLEKGHGGPHPARAYPHIKKVERAAIKEFEKAIEKVVKNAE